MTFCGAGVGAVRAGVAGDGAVGAGVDGAGVGVLGSRWSWGP